MSKLLDKQVDVQNKSLFRNHVSSCKPTKKCAMKMKEEKEKNDFRVKIFVVKGRTL